MYSSLKFKKMNLNHIIQNRRNIKPKLFSGVLVSDDEVKKIIKSSNLEPTHGFIAFAFHFFSGRSK